MRQVIAEGTLPGGAHEIRWDGRGDDGAALGAGRYWVRLTTGRASLVRPFVLLR